MEKSASKKMLCLFISMDGVSGLEAGAKAIFPKVVVQRCITELEKKWSSGYVQNWPTVLNQLMANDLFKERIGQVHTPLR